MKKNVGSIDKVIRLILAAFFIFLVLFKTYSGIFDTILRILALILIVTSLIGYCPLYAILGTKTNKTKS